MSLIVKFVFWFSALAYCATVTQSIWKICLDVLVAMWNLHSFIFVSMLRIFFFYDFINFRKITVQNCLSFVAAISSSRSDHITQFVRPCPFFYFPVSLQLDAKYVKQVTYLGLWSQVNHDSVWLSMWSIISACAVWEAWLSYKAFLLNYVMHH